MFSNVLPGMDASSNSELRQVSTTKLFQGLSIANESSRFLRNITIPREAQSLGRHSKCSSMPSLTVTTVYLLRDETNRKKSLRVTCKFLFLLNFKGNPKT